MLSKQEKLQYGQILRMQMQQKQQRKKLQQLQKKGIQRQPPPNNIYNQNRNTQNILPQNQYIPRQKQNNLIDRKQLLQKKLQADDYNPFGKAGGGAPIKDQNGDIIASRKPRTITNPNGQTYVQLDYSRLQNNNNPSQRQQYNTSIQQNRNQYPQDTPQFNQMNYNNNPQLINQQYQQPQFNRQPYYQQYQQQKHQQHSNFNQPVQQPSFNQFNPNGQYSQAQLIPPLGSISQLQPPIQNQRIDYDSNRNKQQANQFYKKGGRNLLKLQNANQDELSLKQKQKLQMQRILKQQMEQAQLKKQRQQQQIKMRQKLEEQKFNQYVALQKKKMQQQQLKKKQQIEKVRMQNQRNKQLKQQMEAQNKKKKLIQMPQQIQKVQKIIPSEVIVKQKIEKQQIVQKPRMSHQRVSNQAEQDFDYKSIQGAFNTEISKQFIKKQRQRDPQRRKKDRQMEQIKNHITKIRQQSRNNDEIYRLQIDKMKLEAQKAKYEKQKVEYELNKIKQQLRQKINNQNQRLNMALLKNDPREYTQQRNNTFNPNQYKIKSQYKPPYNQKSSYQKNQKPSYRQQEEEQPRVQQIKRVRKIQNNSNNKDYQQPKYKIQPLKPDQNQQLVQKKYSVNDTFEMGLQSLAGQTLKIPVNLPKNDKLSMSRIQQYAVDSRFFNKKSSNNVVQKKQDIIYQQDQDSYRQNNDLKYNQNKYKQNYKINDNPSLDQLDKFMYDNKKNNSKKTDNKWDNMSSVNSQITKQIQKLMKQQKPAYQNFRPPSSNKLYSQQERPASKLSNAGRSIINQDKYGLAAQGFTLKSEQPGTLKSMGTKNTFDLDKINNNNDKRLEKLRQLGIQTLPQHHNHQSQNDPDLKKLDALLHNYQI